MSTSTHKKNHSNSATSDSVLRLAVLEAMRRIATIAAHDETAVISDSEITWQNGTDRTTISVEPMNVVAWDGARIAECITIRTPLTSFKFFDEDKYAFINHFATTGAIVRDTNGKDAIVSKVTLFEGDDDALYELFTPLIANAAIMQRVGPVSGFFCLQGKRDEYGPKDTGIPNWDEPSYWAAAEFDEARDALREHGAYATAGQAGLTVEFPWEEGAISAALGHWTSLLQIRTDVPHPAAGNGLFFALKLPINLGKEEAACASATLNRAEIAGVDTPPFIGAWCSVPDSHTVSFTGFLPNAMYQPGLARRIAFWSWARSRIARQVLGNSTAEGNHIMEIT